MRNTYICDVDGTLLKFIDDFENIQKYQSLPALPGASSKTTEWHCRGDYIILTTARPESLREVTISQLRQAGIIYDLLIMGVGQGKRILINDHNEGEEQKAIAYNLVKNKEGIINIH